MSDDGKRQEAHHPIPENADHGDTTGASAYGPVALAVYDTCVLRFSLRFLWGCPQPMIRALYDRNARSTHLDIGVGTGFFLKKSTAVTPDTRIELLDLNPVPLRTAESRLPGYQVRTHQGNAVAEIPLPDHSVDSVGMANLLHCVPGDLTHKGRAFDQVRRVVRPGGRVFGSTVVGGGGEVHINGAARRVMNAYRAKGAFDNAGDTPEDLRKELEARFTEVDVSVRGCVALFEARA